MSRNIAAADSLCVWVVALYCKTIGNPEVRSRVLVMLVVPNAWQGTSAEDAVDMIEDRVAHVSCTFGPATHNMDTCAIFLLEGLRWVRSTATRVLNMSRHLQEEKRRCAGDASQAAMASEPRQPLWVRWLPGDATSKIDYVKFFIFENSAYDMGPRLMLQLREFCMALGFSVEGTDWFHWFKTHGKNDSWESLLKMIDAHDSDWRPSQRQAIFHELPAEFRRWCGTEVTTSASIIIMLLLDWSSRLRRGHQKQAQLVLADLLQKTLPRLFHVIPAEVYALPDADEAACSFRGPAGLGACRHCANIYEGLPQQLGCSELVGLLHKVWAKKDVCPILKQWCGFVIQGTASLLEDCLVPAVGWQTNAKDLAAPRGSEWILTSRT